jgi:hypothetical protein
LAIVGVAFVAAAVLTWRKWPDVVVDFGMQLYLPWKISTGSVLYRDLNYLTGGPFSQYFDAALFKVFGVSLLTLVFSNLIIAAAFLVLVYRRFLAAADVWTATTIGLGIVLVFAFEQHSDIGNYNFITPYSHEVWHGMVLSAVAITLLSSWVAKQKLRFAAGAGFCAGLVFMTKPDVFAALAMGSVAAFALFAVTKGQRGFVMKSLGFFLLAGAAPLAGFLWYFRRFEDWRASLRSVAFAWVPLLTSGVSKDPFYKWCLGLDAPGINIRFMFVHFLVIGMVVVIFAFLFRLKMDTTAKRLLAAGVVAGLAALASGFDWLDCGRSLPLLSLTLCVILVWKYREFSPELPPIFPLLWGIFGLALLAKMGLFSRVWHYGFVLAVPAFASAVYLLLWLLPMLLAKHGVNQRLFRGAVWLLLMIGFTRLFVQSEFVYANKTLAVGSGADKMLAFDEKTNPVGVGIATALPWLDKNLPPGATLAVLPEGIMVNYLSRRTNPTHYLLWNPNELAAFGQAGMVADFKNNAPDYVMLIQRDASEYGAKYFGQEESFGKELRQWIQQNYEPVLLIGKEPLQTSKFGIKILKRTSNVK